MSKAGPRRSTTSRASSARRRDANAPARGLEGSAPVFAALGDETRLRVVARLCAGGPMSIARLSTGSGVTRQAITKHLQVLANAGLVRGARRGRESIWGLAPERLDEARQYLDRIAREWDVALGRLKTFLEQ